MNGRLAVPTLPSLPGELIGWRWERQDHFMRLVCVATSWSTPWHDEDEPEHIIVIACRYRRVMELDEDTMTTTPSTSFETSRRVDTDLDDALYERLTTAGWKWEYARQCSNGWHHRITSYGGGTIGGRRLTRARIVDLLGDDAPINLPPGGSVEETLRSHGWSWTSEQDRHGKPEYRFRNKFTYEVCRMETLEKRLEHDQRRPLLFSLITEGFVPGPDASGVFRRGPLNELTEVSTKSIRTGRYQPRRTFSVAEIEELAASIKEHGILTRPKVFLNEHGDYELIAGERRLRAAKLLELETIPVEVCEYTLAQIHEISIIDNLQREGLTPVEEGIAYERMASELNISEAELSRRLGKNRAYIQQRRAIGRAAPEVQQALVDGTLTFSQARGLCIGAADNIKAQLAALKTVRDQLKHGRRVDERSAQHEAEKAVQKQVKKEIEALGWKIADSVRALLWSETERPREFTSAELLTIAREKRRPGGTLPTPRAITNDEQRFLDLKGYHDYGSCAPWFVFWGNGADMRVLAPEELPTLVEEIQREYAAMQARYLSAGWQLSHANGNAFLATSSQQRTERPWLWKGVEELIAKIEAGQISDKPEPKQLQTTATITWTCARCKNQYKDMGYTYRGDNEKVCEKCAATIDAERAAKVAEQAKALATRWQASLQHLDLDILQLITMREADNNRAETIGLRRFAGPEEIAKAVLAWDRDALIEMFTRLVAAHEMERWPGWTLSETEERTGGKRPVLQLVRRSEVRSDPCDV